MGVSGIARVDSGTADGGTVAAVQAVTCRVQAIGSLTGTLDIGF
jgi:hypothetical protein